MTIAKVAELADAQDLGSCIARCGGSSPPFRISTQQIHDFNGEFITIREVLI